MLNRTLRALNRLVVRRNADAGLDVRAPDRAAPSLALRGQGTSRRVRLLGALSLAALLLAAVASLQALPLQAQSTTVARTAFGQQCRHYCDAPEPRSPRIILQRFTMNRP